jgi:pimeloyl-ACP methyl ester carboxylesterase
MQEHHLSINGHHLLAYEYNPDKATVPLIFIHGAIGNTGLWEETKIALMDEAHWFSLTLPAHYPARFPTNFQSEDFTAEMMADIMSEAISQLTDGKAAILVGHSTGAFAAFCVAYHRPELVKSIVSVDGFAVGKCSGAFRSAQDVAQRGKTAFWFYWKLLSLGFASFQLAYRGMAAISGSAAFEKTANEAFTLNQKLNIYAMWIYFERLFQMDIRAWLPKIKMLVSIIHGKNDSVILPEHALEMQTLLPNSQMLWIDSDHNPMFEKFPAYEAALTSALEGAMRETRARA